jgi:nucleotide-binding universal stress UspA family protein
MSSALLGILQLDKGEPYGYAHVAGLIQLWLQGAGGFAMIGLVVYLLYALLTPTDKSESEKIRVPVSMWMVGCAALAVIAYAAYFGLVALAASGTPTLAGRPLALPAQPQPPPGMPVVPLPPEFHLELQELALMFAGLFALLGIGEPFARDMAKIFRRNLSLRFSGVQRFGRSVANYTRGLMTSRRLAVLGVSVALYAVLGVVVYFVVPGLFGIYLGVCIVAATVAVLALLALMLFEAEGPVWAVAKLSFKEAVRSQLLWVFLIIFLPFLFPSHWFRQYKPADELRVTVGSIVTALTLLVLVPAVLLASFGIPNDIKNLNIYTVVTKPIERFEMVLGRFVGYVSLMTLVLIGLTGVSLVLVTNSSISERARQETYKARVPVRGSLEFKGLIGTLRDFDNNQEFAGTNVGREFDYRKYIGGGRTALQRAIWHFEKLPSALATAENDRVPVEFTFDVFKMTKGEQNKGVGVHLRFVTHHARQQQPLKKTEEGEWHWQDSAKEKAYGDAVKELERKGIRMDSIRPGSPGWAEINKLAEEHGCFERSGVQVFDYQVGGVEIPAGLIRGALAGDPGTMKVKDPLTGQEKVVPVPRLSVYVKCQTQNQQLGMAQPDLYMLEYEQPFAWNYLKGMVGLWCWLCVIVGLAVTWSTYLSGVLSLLVVLVIFTSGFFMDFFRDLSAGRSVGGGPFQSMSQIIKAEQPTTPLAETAGTKALTVLDRGAAWGYRHVSKVVPELEASDWGDFVSEGYNINTEYLVLNLLVTFGYLLPWAILAYWMMKLREVAA